MAGLKSGSYISEWEEARNEDSEMPFGGLRVKTRRDKTTEPACGRGRGKPRPYKKHKHVKRQELVAFAAG